jgi:predicted secreted protein
MYLKNAGTDFKPSINIEESVRIVVEADSQEAADNSRIGYVDIRMWELDKVED